MRTASSITSIWVIRILFLLLATLGGYAVAHRPEFLKIGPVWGAVMGFGCGGLLIAIDEMLKGFSLRAFSAATFGLALGTAIAWMIDHSQLFIYVEEEQTLWLIRLVLFVGFGYLGMVLAMRSNKEDFSLIIPYVRFASRSQAEDLLLLDTSVVIDGRIADLLDGHFLQGTVVVPRFVLKELQSLADSEDSIKRARGRRGLEMLARLQKSRRTEVKIHEGDLGEETEVDMKLLRLAKLLPAKLFTNDYNLGKIAELQSVPHVNLKDLSLTLKPVLLPGEILPLKLVREGKERGQGVGYLPDGTMVVVNQGKSSLGRLVEVQVISLLQTGAGVIVFADMKQVVDKEAFATTDE